MAPRVRRDVTQLVPRSRPPSLKETQETPISYMGELKPRSEWTLLEVLHHLEGKKYSTLPLDEAQSYESVKTAPVLQRWRVVMGVQPPSHWDTQISLQGLERVPLPGSPP